MRYWDFLNIIVEKDRQKDIPKIFEYFVDKAKEYKGIGKVKVVSATELSARQKEKLTKRLLETTKYTSFEVDYQVDPSCTWRADYPNRRQSVRQQS